jgi:hypothetical protein
MTGTESPLDDGNMSSGGVAWAISAPPGGNAGVVPGTQRGTQSASAARLPVRPRRSSSSGPALRWSSHR